MRLAPWSAVVALAACLGHGSASAQDAAEPADARFECPPAQGPITIDGVLDPQEWVLGRAIEIRDENQFVRKAANYGGPADLSGRILVCRSATTLYVAGEVRDDVIDWNPDVRWKGDGVEVFFDIRRDASPRETDQYDRDTYQLLLQPLANEVRWSFASFRGRAGQTDDPLDGIELAGMRFQDEGGKDVGYRFEVALPLANFPGTPTAKGESIGFDVALSDSDGQTQKEQRNYATWSGRANLASFPSRFGRLVLGDDPPAVAPPAARGGSPILPIAFLVVVLGLVLAVWLTRGLDAQDSRVAAGIARLGAIPARRKLVWGGALLALLVLAGPAATLVARAKANRDLADKREVAALVRNVAGEAGTIGLGRPQPPVHPSPLLSLLTGQAVKAPVDFEFTVLPPMSVGEGSDASAEGTARTYSGVPFLRRDIPATALWSGSFLVQPAVEAEAVTIVYSWHPDPGAESGPKPGDVIADVHVAYLTGTVEAAAELVWGRHVDGSGDRSAVPGGAHPGAPEASVAFVTTGDSETPQGAPPAHFHADELRVPLSVRDSPVVRIEVERRASGGRFTTHGITLHRSGGGEPVPLPLGRTTRGGIPTAACAFPAPDAGLLLSRAVPQIDVPCDVIADRVWLVVSLKKGFPDGRFGLPVLAVRAEFDDGSTDGPYPLENGVDVDAETSPARHHGDAFRSELAFEWGLPDETPRHSDLWSVQLARSGRRLARLHLEFKGADEVVRVSSITLGAPGRPPKTDDLRTIESTADGCFRLAAALRERLDVLRTEQGLEFTSFRDGTALATTAKGADRDRALARTVTEDAAAKILRTAGGVDEERIVESRRVHALSVQLPGAKKGSFVEMTWTGTAEASFVSLVTKIRTLLGILLAPIAVLLVADGILKLRTFHARLVAVCAAVSAVPAVLGYFAIPELVGGQIEGTEREAVLEKAAIVKARIAALPGAARARAEAALGDHALVEALRLGSSENLRPTVSAALKDIERNLTTETVPGARIALDHLPLSGGAQREVFPSDAQFTVFRDRVSRVTSTLAYRWSRLTARGAAQRFATEGDWQDTLVVDLPVDRAALDAAAAAAGGDVQVRIYTPRGFPLAETAARVPGDELPEACERKLAIVQRVLREQQPVIETPTLGGTDYTVAYDVLRGESGDVSLVATALPRTGADALLARVGQASLLIFGAGVAVQFLLLGLVAVATSRPLRRVVERARAISAETPSGDEIDALAGAVAELQAERDVYRGEVARLSAAVADLAKAHDPDAVVATALELTRGAAAPWGAVLVTTDPDGRHEVSGGFRGAERVARMPIVIGEHSPLLPVVRGRGEAHVAAVGTVADSLSRDERRLVEGSASLAAYPLASEDDRGGALVLLERPAPAGTPPRRVHDDFLAALARQAGLALSSARLVRLAVRDAETGVHVASYFAERLREEVDRAVAAKRPIALVVAAVSVPPVDPRESRSAAQRLAERLRASLPQRAFLGRIEPFVFAMAVPEFDRAAAEALATALRRAAAEPSLAELRVRVGYAACPEDAGSSEFLQAEARRRLLGEVAPESARTAVAPDAGDQLVAEARKHGAVFVSDEGRALLETIQRIASSSLTILVEGETGTGKEVVADLVHRWSPRRDKPLVKINCAALPDALLESELFGYERGAFTGADRAKPGRFELAEGGTLFLDEVGEMPLATQAKLLRVLEDRTVEHLGGTRPIAIDVRVIVATNRDLGRMVAEGRFREDLYYRLNAFTIAIPPLRARKEDIPALADACLRSAAETQGRKPPTLQPDAMDVLYRHDWPGNVRELRNLMEQVVVLRPADTIRAADLLPSLVKSQRPRLGDASRDASRTNGSGSPGASAAGGGGSRDLDSPAAVSDRQKRLLALLGERTWITTTDYCEIVGISPRTALRDVRELVERGVIVMEGKRRGARYRLP